tara:strand:- start:556 stop:846 length:291 start_codon:yes stop_codon:yes gene_type:complete
MTIKKNATLTKENAISCTLRSPSNRGGLYAISFIEATDNDIYVVVSYSDGYESTKKTDRNEARKHFSELKQGGWILVNAYCSSITTDQYGRIDINR